MNDVTPTGSVKPPVTDIRPALITVTGHFRLGNIQRRPRWEIGCWECGRMFLAIRETAMLCSPRCRKRWNRARQHGRAVKHRNASIRLFIPARYAGGDQW